MFDVGERNTLLWMAEEIRDIATRARNCHAEALEFKPFLDGLSSAVTAIENAVAHESHTDQKEYDLTRPIDVSNLTANEIADLRKSLYLASTEVRNACLTICRQLGESLSVSYGPKFKWSYDELVGGLDSPDRQLEIYVDDYGGYMTVHYRGNQVLSTHDAEKLFVPGGWVQIIREQAPNAYRVAAERAKKREERRRKHLAYPFQAGE